MAVCIYSNELHLNPKLAHQMYEDRAYQFHQRLGWDVLINDAGEERDEYDLVNPLYIIDVDSEGNHRGSMRFLPTTGEFMMADHFPLLEKKLTLERPLVWECTRFCLSADADSFTAQRLLAYGAILMKEFRLEAFVAIYDARMERLYRRLSAAPEKLAEMIDRNGNKIISGLWHYSKGDYEKLLGLADVGFSDLEFVPSSTVLLPETERLSAQSNRSAGSSHEGVIH